MKRFTQLLLFILLNLCFSYSFAGPVDQDHKTCKNDCNHTTCGHPNCSHNKCKNDCHHTTCGHPNCSHNSCKNDCNHTTCGHPNCSHNKCKNDCNHTTCGHPNCSHNSCKNDCKHTTCGHPNCCHNSCHNDCNHSGCGHTNCGKLRLGNQVWNDRDGDGKRDDNEPAIAGAPISLYTDNNSDNLPDGAAIRTTQSDAQGHYLFTNLQAGRYIASMPILPGYQQSPNDSSGSYRTTTLYPDNNVDNDNNLVRLVGPNGPGGVVFTHAITLSVNGEPTTDGDDANGNLTFDLAECGNAGIGDFVWNDLNGNGIQDAGEPGINGVTVTITFPDGRTATDVTHNYHDVVHNNAPPYDGFYDFINLGPGTYKITFGAPPAGFHASPALQGSDRSKDSNPVDGAPVTVTLAANQSDFTIDAGFTTFTPPPPPPTCPNLSVGNMVFNDANGNGVKDANEQGIAGLTVKLYNANGNNVSGAAISTVMTAADGTYYFSNLAKGDYIVGVTTGNGYKQDAIGDQTPNDNKDNDNNGIRTSNGEVFSNAISLSSGDEPINDGSDNNSNLTLDFGLTSVCGTHCDCHNDCNHVGCGHPNCGHNSCKNDCNHTNCGHPNCAHNSCHNDCHHTNCGHPNCSHNKCHNDCDHKNCGHANCGKKSGYRTDEVTSSVVSVYPNPTTSYFQLKVDAVKSGTAQVRITDASGHIVATKEVTFSTGSNNVTFSDLSNLKSGRYNVQVLFNYQVYNEQLLLVK